MLIDSHCHLHLMDLAPFDNDMDAVIKAAADNGVEKLLCVSVDLEDHDKLIHLTTQYDSIFFSTGIHPCSHEPEGFDAEMLRNLSDHKRCIAIGETGLDYYHVDDKQKQRNQRERFATHIQTAINTGKPLIIHMREAANDTLQIMKDEKAADIGGVMHCFTETWDIAKRALDLNFYISIPGIVTFKNAAALREVAKKIPLDRLLIETDSPYLAPVPYRGKQNQPAFVKYVAMALAELHQISFEKMAQQTTDNFYRCFRVS